MDTKPTVLLKQHPPIFGKDARLSDREGAARPCRHTTGSSDVRDSRRHRALSTILSQSQTTVIRPSHHEHTTVATQERVVLPPGYLEPTVWTPPTIIVSFRPVLRQPLGLEPDIDIVSAKLSVIVQSPRVHPLSVSDGKRGMETAEDVAESRFRNSPSFLKPHHLRLQQQAESFPTSSAAEALRHPPQLALFATAEGEDVSLVCQDHDVVAAGDDLDRLVVGGGVDQLGGGRGDIGHQTKGTV